MSVPEVLCLVHGMVSGFAASASYSYWLRPLGRFAGFAGSQLRCCDGLSRSRAVYIDADSSMSWPAIAGLLGVASPLSTNTGADLISAICGHLARSSSLFGSPSSRRRLLQVRVKGGSPSEGRFSARSLLEASTCWPCGFERFSRSHPPLGCPFFAVRISAAISAPCAAPSRARACTIAFSCCKIV
jgi:hypothetical protein